MYSEAKRRTKAQPNANIVGLSSTNPSTMNSAAGDATATLTIAPSPARSKLPSGNGSGGGGGSEMPTYGGSEFGSGSGGEKGKSYLREMFSRTQDRADGGVVHRV